MANDQESGLQPSQAELTVSPLEAVGITGLKISGGIIIDDPMVKLHGEKGRAIFRQMSDDSSVIGGILFSIEMLLRSSEWSVNPASDDPEHVEQAKFLKSVMDDMDHTWDEFLTEVMSMLIYGWSYHEIVLKRRVGPNKNDSTLRSRFNDGLIGVKRLAPRGQNTLMEWAFDEQGDLLGMWQYPPIKGQKRFVPISKSLLFRPHANLSSPEGRSVLRRAWRSYYFSKTIEEIEAIAIERELNGLPVMSIPSDILAKAAGDDEAAKKAVGMYTKIVRDVKLNDQGGVILPSDTYHDAEGRPSSVKKYSLDLISSQGTRSIDTNATIARLEQNMSRAIIADFIMLGSNDRGSFALADAKIDMFMQAIEGWQEIISDTLNRNLVPMLWEMNGFDSEHMPEFAPAKLSKESMSDVGQYLQSLAAAGMPIFPDEDLEAQLRAKAGLTKRADSEML